MEGVLITDAAKDNSYNLILPDTMNNLGHARIMLLVRTDLVVQKLSGIHG